MKNTSVAHYFNLYQDSEIVFYTVIVELVKNILYSVSKSFQTQL